MEWMAVESSMLKTPTGSAVDVSPTGRASDVREMVQYRRGSGAVKPELKELRTHVLDQS